MAKVVESGWVVDLENMTCLNSNTKMVVEFQKSGKTYVGKIRDMPIKLMAGWAKLKHGERLIERAVLEAEEVFLKAKNNEQGTRKNEQ